VYRVLYRRNQAAVPALETLELAADPTDNP
jgi:hypothetical protein